MRTMVLSTRRPDERRHALLVVLAVTATLAVTVLGVMAFLSLMAVTASAATAESYPLSGDRVEVCNLAGSVRVVNGPGPGVEVVVTRGGRDAGRLRVTRDHHDGLARLHVVYPERNVVYPNMRNHGSTNLTVGSDGCLAHRSGFGFGRRVRISSSGGGMQAWADLEIRVPKGCAPTIRLGAGDVTATGVEGTLTLDIASGPIRTERTRGTLSIDTGSGAVTLAGHDGDLSVDTGSGGVDVADVRGAKVKLDTGSGHVNVSGLIAEDLVVDTGSGTVALDKISARSIGVDTGSGSVRVALDTSPRSLQVDTGSGGVAILAPPDLGAVVDLESGSGGIETDFAMSLVSHEHGELRGTIGDGRGRIAVDVGSGGVSLRKR
jgi:lia operon protein LiaG